MWRDKVCVEYCWFRSKVLLGENKMIKNINKNKGKETEPKGKQGRALEGQQNLLSGQYVYSPTGTRVAPPATTIEATPAVPEPDTQKVLKSLVDVIETLGLFEAIFGFIFETGCRVVCIANELSNEERDSVWEIVWEFRGKFPALDIEVTLMQRRGRQVSEVFDEGNLANIKREFLIA